MEKTKKSSKKSSVKKSSNKVNTSKKATSKVTAKETTKKTPKKKSTYVKKNYYLFKMNTTILNIISIFLLIFVGLVFYFIYGKETVNVFYDNIVLVMFLYVPYLILHELLHSISYCLYGADFKNITYGAYLEKGVLCCLCKQNINKRNILYSLLYPFFFIGVLTLIIGLIFNIPLLVILSLVNIAGCSGDFVMFYHLVKLNDFEFSEYDDPIAFGLYTKQDFSELNMYGLDFVTKKTKLERNDFKKIRFSKISVLVFIIFYLLMIGTLLIK